MQRFKILILLLVIGLVTFSTSTLDMTKEQEKKKLQHIVLIQFKEDSSAEDVAKIQQAAMTLKEIAGVNQLLFRENISPENLNQGYTHSLTMWFASEKDRDEIYLPHPLHQDFVALFVPQTEKVLVFDYWE